MTTVEVDPLLTPDPEPGARPRRRRNVAVTVGGTVAGLLVLTALVSLVWTPYDPTGIDPDAVFAGPFEKGHVLGTDNFGADILSQLMAGARVTLLVGVVSVAIAGLVGAPLGVLAGMRRGFLGEVIVRSGTILFAFPALLLALLLIAIAGPSALTQIFAVGLGTAPGYARMVRGQILAAKRSGYVQAAVALGHSPARIVRAHILPNALRPLVAIFALSVGQSIVWASSLAFLGLGVAPPSPEWGALLDAGRSFIVQAGWLVVIPGLVIVALALAATTVGRHLQTGLEKGEK
jgi:peptide/nickel transport system permease protein